MAAIVGTVLHLCINNSYKLADLSIIQPVWFTQLIFASLLGFIIFGSLPDLYTWIGAILVFSSVLIITYRENYLKKDIAKFYTTQKLNFIKFTFKKEYKLNKIIS